MSHDDFKVVHVALTPRPDWRAPAGADGADLIHLRMRAALVQVGRPAGLGQKAVPVPGESTGPRNGINYGA